MSKRHRAVRNADAGPQQVYGEDLRGMVEFLAEFYASPHPIGGGLARFELAASKERVEPFLRALLRAEAELLITDAARQEVTQRSLRSASSRRHDALVLLTWRTLAAKGVPNCDEGIRAMLDDDPNQPLTYNTTDESLRQ